MLTKEMKFSVVVEVIITARKLYNEDTHMDLKLSIA